MKKQILVLARLAFTSALFAGMTTAALAKGKGESYQTGFIRWRAAPGAFAGWTRESGVKLNASGALEFDPATAGAQVADPYAAGTFYSGNYYNGGTFYVGKRSVL